MGGGGRGEGRGRAGGGMGGGEGGESEGVGVRGMEDDADRETHTTRVFFATLLVRRSLFVVVNLFVRPRESPRKRDDAS